MAVFDEDFLSGDDFELALVIFCFYVFMTMVQTRRQLRISLQMEKIITNVPCAL